MIRLLECSPNSSDATSFYRARGPITYLCRQHDDIQHTYLQNYIHAKWDDVLPYDVIFVQRPSTEREFNFLLICKRLGKKVWLDYDDLLTDIPPSNPVFHVNPDCAKWVYECCSIADLITVTTQPIKDKLLFSGCKNIHVVKNAHNDFVLPMAHAQKDGQIKQPKIIWRGGITHEMDLFDYRVDMREIIDTFPAVRMFGNVSTYIKRDLGILDKMNIPGLPLEEYLNYLCQYNPTFLVFPIEDSEFNRAKSNIAAIEALYSGAICIVPEGFREFAGTSVSAKKGEFVETINAILDSDMKSIRRNQLEKIQKDQVLSVTNEIRYKLITELTNN